MKKNVVLYPLAQNAHRVENLLLYIPTSITVLWCNSTIEKYKSRN